MLVNLQLNGDGVSVLRSYLATHLTARQLKEPAIRKLLEGDEKNVMATGHLRHVTTILSGLRVLDASTPTLVSLLRQGQGTRARVVASYVYENEAAQVERAKYLAERRRKLLRLDEEIRYSSMVRNVKPQSADKELAYHLISVRQHLSIGANMVMARITAFVAVYFVARNLTENETTRLMFGLGGAIVMMMIEMVLFITRAAKFESIEIQRKKHKSIF
ncbi:hypothetical protein CCR75_000476 [Bremia lactucae]|uniref:Uncharacterized protein n=1 Tax=Bremia lactucae TaxID=4779 RepID=A0A976FL44_BRELC|nr:hypothetical protein CCR75_000476 [Bremia lactucae]